MHRRKHRELVKRQKMNYGSTSVLGRDLRYKGVGGNGSNQSVIFIGSQVPKQISGSRQLEVKKAGLHCSAETRPCQILETTTVRGINDSGILTNVANRPRYS